MDGPVAQLFRFREAVPLLRQRLTGDRCRQPGTTEFQTRMRTGDHLLILYPSSESQRRLVNLWIINADPATLRELDSLLVGDASVTPGALGRRISSHSEMLKMRLGTIYLLISWGAYAIQKNVLQ
jgi:hypothetical protein